MFPKLQSGTLMSVGATHSVMNWQRPVSFTAGAQKEHILLAIDEYQNKTPIRLREYDSLNDMDYIHMAGENSGCWSYVGRIGGVSITVQVVVRKRPALRTAPLGFRSNPHPKTKTKPVKPPPPVHYEQFSNRPVRTAVTHSRTSCELTNDQKRDADSWVWNLVQ